MTRALAGIGARVTPPAILAEMTRLAEELSRAGWTLRSGHAPGADQAWEAGACIAGPAGDGLEVFLPWETFGEGLPKAPWCRVFPEPTPPAYRIAALHHPAWVRLSGGARRLHARNAHIILGAGLAAPADVVVCWTPGGEDVGGTGQALRVARAAGVPVVNLAVEGASEQVRRLAAAQLEAAR